MRPGLAAAALLLIAAAPNPATKIAAYPVGGPPPATASVGWGLFEDLARREWTTEKDARPRVSRFKWVEPGRVLVGRHGPQTRLAFGDARFADTVQRFERNPATGRIAVTYTYEDGRPPLRSTIVVQPDGSAVESFTDAKGIEKRNIYRLRGGTLNIIERQEKQGAAWASLGTTQRSGLTYEQIADNKRMAEELAAAQVAAQRAQEQARIAQEQAQREADEAERQAAYEQQQAQQQTAQQDMPNMLDVLNGIGASIQRDNQQRQAQFNRQLQQIQDDAARKRADAARAEANRIAAENARRVQEANARQQAISDQYAQRNAASQSQAQAAQAQAEADRTRRAEVQRSEQQRAAAQAAADQRAAAQQQAADAERRRQAEVRAQEQARRLAELNASVDWKESVTLCEKTGPQAQFGNWRCTGSLQMNYVNFENPYWVSALDKTCGGPRNKRDLGMVGGYRAFGCGFGLPPSSTDDIPARFGVGYVPGRITFRCPRSASSCDRR